MRTRIAVLGAGAVLLVWSCSSKETTNDGHFQQVGGNSANANSTADMASTAASGGASSASSQQASSSSAKSSSASTGSGGSGCADAVPNNSEDAAVVLPDQSDCDKIAMITGTLGNGDQDWYKYKGSDDLGCSVDPTRTLSADAQVRLCKFASCTDAAVTCPGGTTKFKSPKGLDGCCAEQGFSIKVDCKGISDDATIYIFLDKPQGPQCVNYTVTYHY